MTHAPTESPTLVDGVALYESGPTGTPDRPPLVLVHGGMHGAWIWDDVRRDLASRGRRSVALDWYSHGASRQLPRDEWLRRPATAARREIATACAAVDVGGPAPVVLAHSMGGLAALAHAATRPAHLGGLVLLAPVVPREFAPAPIPLDGLRPDAPFGPFPPAVANELFFDGLDAEQARRFSDRLQGESPAATAESVRWTAEVDVARIEVPMLLFGAEHDRLVPAGSVRALAAAAGAAYVELPGTGHGIPVNPGWEQVLSLAVAWIDLVVAGAGR